MKRYCAEFIGTFVLVPGGVGGAVLAGAHIGVAGVALAFGLSLLVMIYAIGHLSEGHVNPAVALGMLLSRRIGRRDAAGDVIMPPGLTIKPLGRRTRVAYRDRFTALVRPLLGAMGLVFLTSPASVTAEPPPGVVSTRPATAQPSPPPRTSAVTVYLNMTVRKNYGVLARMSGRENSVERSAPYNIDNPWWGNPLVVYADERLTQVDAKGHAHSDPIVGRGRSSNVTVRVTLVPHADLALASPRKIDGIKGTITVTIAAWAQYYDGGWTDMVSEKGRQMTFTFDTCDPQQSLVAVASEMRTVAPFSFERYTRDRERWAPRSSWPVRPRSGDWRTVIDGTNATLEVTGYRYVDAPPALVESSGQAHSGLHADESIGASAAPR